MSVLRKLYKELFLVLTTKMKSLITASIFAVFSATLITAKSLKTAGPDNVHVVCPPSQDGFVVFVPHPYECTKYFMCQGSTGISMDCPGDLQFDPDLNVCNYEWAVGCVNKPYPTTTIEPETTTEADETTTIEDEDQTTVFSDYDEYFHL